MMKEEVEMLHRTGQGAEGAQGGTQGEAGAGETSRRSSWISRQESGQHRPTLPLFKQSLFLAQGELLPSVLVRRSYLRMQGCPSNIYSPLEGPGSEGPWLCKFLFSSSRSSTVK